MLAAIHYLRTNLSTKLFQRLYSCLQGIVNSLRFKRAFLAGKTVSLVDCLHREQGSTVHVGAVLVSNTIEGFEQIYGTSSKHGGAFHKSPWYTFVSGYPDLFSDQDPGHHARTRRLFSESFTPRSIGGHEETMVQHVEKLMGALRRAQGSVVGCMMHSGGMQRISCLIL
jgi:hypothetical protein